jgi:hypothetical protein
MTPTTCFTRPKAFLSLPDAGKTTRTRAVAPLNACTSIRWSQKNSVDTPSRAKCRTDFRQSGIAAACRGSYEPLDSPHFLSIIILRIVGGATGLEGPHESPHRLTCAVAFTEGRRWRCAVASSSLIHRVDFISGLIAE